ncbi:ornithine cyclodeaminase family protein [bacterium]|nr:ornithine cyclodeaminase family protein [bacterium]
MEFKVLDAKTIRELIGIEDVIEAVENIFKDYGHGDVRMPSKIYLDVSGGDFRAMPASVPGLAGIKWVNVHPGNSALGLPVVMAMILINDPKTGRPLGLLDGTWITQARTGAAAAVATKHLARPDSETVGMIGCGGQSATMLKAIGSVMKIEKLYLADKDHDRAAGLAKKFENIDIQIVDTALAAAADVVCTLTPSRTPVVMADWIRPGTHINAMGADAAGKEELDPEILKDARVFVDDWAQASHSGEINVPLKNGVIQGVAGSLCDLLVGKVKGRMTIDEVTVFDSTGLAIQDMAVARMVWEKAQKQNAGVTINLEP